MEPTHSQSVGRVGPDEEGRIDPLAFGAKGDGITDDTVAFQKALSFCSERGATCEVTPGKSFLITKSLYIWGKANLVGDTLQGTIVFNNNRSPYLINVGISAPQSLEQPFSGEIRGVTFKVVGGKGGRTLFFWRTDGAVINKNLFDFGSHAYSATSSGNDNSIVKNGFLNCIRKNIAITDNIITATADYDGSEGIGLGNFDGALIMNNRVTGVGDDPIGIHLSKNVKILENDLASIDGRIFVANSVGVTIANNRHVRMRSPVNGKFREGISLLYVGFETFKANDYSAPRDIRILLNTLHYPPGSIDQGAAIYLYGPREVSVERNEIVNDSTEVAATAIRVLPAVFEGEWKDPESLDPSYVARVHNATIIENVSRGGRPLPIGMSGNCDQYVGKLAAKNNTASHFHFYCPNVIAHGNKRILSSH
jgi:hypothetical protein